MISSFSNKGMSSTVSPRPRWKLLTQLNVCLRTDPWANFIHPSPHKQSETCHGKLRGWGLNAGSKTSFCCNTKLVSSAKPKQCGLQSCSGSQTTNNNSLSIDVESPLSILIIMNLPDWNTYLAKACINKAGHVGGDDSDDSLFSRNVNSKP